MAQDGRVRIMADVPPEVKEELDKYVHWGLRSDFLSAVLSNILDALEKDDKGILVGLIIARKIRITWVIEDVI